MLPVTALPRAPVDTIRTYRNLSLSFFLIFVNVDRYNANTTPASKFINTSSRLLRSMQPLPGLGTTDDEWTGRLEMHHSVCFIFNFFCSTNEYLSTYTGTMTSRRWIAATSKHHHHHYPSPPFPLLAISTRQSANTAHRRFICSIRRKYTSTRQNATQRRQ
jgi:hypothetical protein